MIKHKFICSLIIMSSFLSGCASVSHVPLSKSNAQSIKTVYVDPNIKKSDEMLIVTRVQKFGQTEGVLPHIIANSVSEDSVAEMKRAAKSSQLDINKIVYHQWKSKLAEKSKFKLISSKNADATLVTEIETYGVSASTAFSSDYFPVITISARLMRKNMIVWQNSESVVPLDVYNLPKYKWEQIINDPKKINSILEKASEYIINTMLADINDVK